MPSGAEEHPPQAPRTAGGPLKVLRVGDLPPGPDNRPDWLIEALWAREAVGLIGGAPKSCKTYLALEMALAVASGTPCLGRFSVHEPGPVLVFAAEDAPTQVRDRIQGLARARDVNFERLPIFLILAEQIRLDVERDQRRLAEAIVKYRPRLLVLDPFVRLHRLDENKAADVSRLLADLRALQRRFHLAVLLVHHTRKGNGPVAGQALRGSSDLHAWGDSNLYLKKTPEHRAAAAVIRLSVEHRAARATEPIMLALTGDPARLELTAAPDVSHESDLLSRVLRILGRHPAPMAQTQLRTMLKVRNQSLTSALRRLEGDGKITRANGTWMLSSRTHTRHLTDDGPLFSPSPT